MFHRYHTRPPDPCGPPHMAFFWGGGGICGYLPSPAFSPPPHLHRRIFKVFGILRGECNMVQSVSDHLPASPEIHEIFPSSLLKTNSSVYVHCTNIARAPLIHVAQPTNLQFLDDGTQHAKHTQVRKV